MSEKLTITLTGRAPVTITKDSWPVIASARDWDNTYECQANKTWRISVRQHADGRAIVYGVHTNNWQGASGRRGGELLSAGDDIASAIYRVADALGFDCRLADDCVSTMPAEEL